MAGAYKVPEQSINSMALGAAYVAHTEGADTAYYNPANMAFMADKQFMEAGVTLAHLPRNEFSGTQTYPVSDEDGNTIGSISPDATNKSEIENLQLPFFHYVSKPMGDFRWGTSLTVPGGLTKRWDSGHQKVSAEEFTLKVIELSPSASYKVSDKFAVGGGVRLIYSEGVVKSDGTAVAIPYTRDMEGDTIEFGYNLAMTYKPTSDINMAMTYRSNVDLKEEGAATLGPTATGTSNYGATVTVPLPAALNLAVSKTWLDKYTVELNYERTYWSTYEELDFDYDASIGALVPVFDYAKAKNWNDTDTFRVGVTAKVMDNVTVMAGYAKDETPIDKKYISYELPDSDADIYTVGVRIKANENLSYGLAYLHDEKESFSLAAGENEGGIIGKFSEGGADLLTVGMSYTF